MASASCSRCAHASTLQYVNVDCLVYTGTILALRGDINDNFFRVFAENSRIALFYFAFG